MINHLIPDRWGEIIRLVETQGSASVEDISRALDISPATVRRDLARINERGLITRTRGGAIPSQKIHLGHTVAQSRKTNPQEKELIGRAAAKLVKNNAILVLDGGYTTYQVAQHLQAEDLHVITNSFDVLQAMLGHDNSTVIMLGGELSIVSGTTVGPVTARQMLDLCVDMAILGADAISCEDGLCSPSPVTAQTKTAMIQKAEQIVIVADHSKLGHSALYHIVGIEKIATLVTDDKADPALLEDFRKAGLEVIIAKEDNSNDNP
jgi:DeoR/GlpR family transcriptional regulator of sugar metabolism